MKRNVTVFISFFVLFVFTQNSFASSDWEPAIKKNGIEAYSRTIEGSDILEIRAIAVVDAKMEEVAELLRDVSANALWRPNCKLSELIKLFDRNTMITYTVIDLPWPVSDRDVIVKAETSISYETGRAIVNLRAVEHQSRPLKKGHVRITEFFSEYLLEYISRERTGIIFTTQVNPAGRIPVFLINLFNKKYAYDEMIGLMKMVKDPKYIAAGKRSQDRETIESLLNNEKKVQQIFTARLKEFIKDQDFIQMIVNNKKLIKEMGSGSGEIDELILYGMGLRTSQEKAVKRLLHEHLKYTSNYDKKLIDLITNDKELIDMILDGKKDVAGSFDDIINARIKRKVAFQEKK